MIIDDTCTGDQAKTMILYLILKMENYSIFLTLSRIGILKSEILILLDFKIVMFIWYR